MLLGVFQTSLRVNCGIRIPPLKHTRHTRIPPSDAVVWKQRVHSDLNTREEYEAGVLILTDVWQLII
jgi:hypothetical protein